MTEENVVRILYYVHPESMHEDDINACLAAISFLNIKRDCDSDSSSTKDERLFCQQICSHHLHSVVGMLWHKYRLSGANMTRLLGCKYSEIENAYRKARHGIKTRKQESGWTVKNGKISLMPYAEKKTEDR